MDWKHNLRRVDAPLPIWHGIVTRDEWSTRAGELAASGGRLVSMWGVARHAGVDGVAICAAIATRDGLVWLELPFTAGEESYPDLAHLFPCAGRLQRAVADLSGMNPEGAADRRPWLDHGLWGEGGAPLSRAEGSCTTPQELIPADYAFVRVEGEGVHEFAVGPVHAGIIEPGHFRFSVVGEKVLRLEEHLGYVHKGIERRFTELPPQEAYRLAGRVSGDSTVAFAWAYCMALESAWRSTVPVRATWLRALLLERERIANHLGDLGALANDAALSFGLAQFSRLREDWQRQSREAFGHRLMMDVVVPGGVAVDPGSSVLAMLSSHCEAVALEVQTLRRIYDQHAGLQDRFVSTGRVTPQLAAQLGLTGLAGRASGQAFDLRCDFPWSPFEQCAPKKSAHQSGDVAARVAVRFDELLESLRIVRELCGRLPGGDCRVDLPVPGEAASGMGWVEGWRGEVLVALEIDANGRITRCHCHDPSWQNWPVLEHAIIGNIVPDFPLINKSFNLSYAGHDL